MDQHPQEADGMGCLPTHLTADAKEAARKDTDASLLPAHLGEALDTWRATTGEQVAASAGR